MEYTVKILITLFLFAFSVHTNAALLSLSENNNSSLMSTSGWIDENTSAIDFYRFSLTNETTLSFLVDATASIGLSLYQGDLTMDPGFLFNHSTDFVDFTGENYVYITGTDPFYPGAGDNSLTSGLLSAGQYTLALGGNEGFDIGNVSYSLTAIPLVNTAVPQPATMSMAALMVAILVWRRKASK